MRKRAYRCMVAALVAALIFLPDFGGMSVSVQAAEESEAAGNAAETKEENEITDNTAEADSAAEAEEKGKVMDSTAKMEEKSEAAENAVEEEESEIEDSAAEAEGEKATVDNAVQAMAQCIVAASIKQSVTITSAQRVATVGEAAVEAEPELQQGLQAEATKTYTDGNGVTFSWYGYEDGTAEIYQFDFTKPEIVMEIPGTLEGYVVTKITGEAKEKDIQSVTIPESVILFGQNTFEKCVIGELHYNAVDAAAGDSVLLSPFYGAEIGNFYIGDKVEVIRPHLFYRTVFQQEEIVLKVPHIGSGAFYGASIRTLTVTDEVLYLDTQAFMDTEIQLLHFNSPDVTVGVGSTSGGPFYGAVIHNLDFCGEMTKIPDYLFSCAHFKMKEFTFTQERIGTYAFWQAWDGTMLDGGADRAERITLTADVKTLGEKAFLGCHMEELVIESNLENEADAATESPFYEAFIYKLTLGKGVTKLPDYLFSYANFKMTELTVETPYVGTGCFYGAWVTFSGSTSPVELTVTENVEYIGASAFAYNKISRLSYMTNAVNGSASSLNGPFGSSEVTELEIGGNVGQIQPMLFADTKFTQDIDMTIDVPIGDYAFFSSGTNYKGFSNLTVGGNVSSMGKGAFQRRNIGNLSFEAIYAPNQLTYSEEGPFYGCTVGQLTFGQKVELLDKALLCGVKLKQEELVIPDSVQEIGDYFIYNLSYLNDGIVVDTLRIGSGLKKLAGHSFHQAGFQSIYVEAVEGGEDFNLWLPEDASGYLPVCENLFIHRGSDFYGFFARNAGEEHYYCEDYMTTALGEEAFDQESRRFVTTTYETCSVCGYQTQASEYEDAFAVTFMAMEKEVDVRYCKRNGSVEAPEAPEYDGYRFEGWDKPLANITGDMVVTAIYSEIPESGEGKEPEVTPEPDEGKEPEVTPGPDEGKEPEITPEPDEDKEPEMTPEPDEDKEQEVTPGPNEDREPEVTPGPDEDKEPGVTPGTGEDKEPEVTQEPDEGKEPGVAPEPDGNKEPEVTPETDKDKEPEVSPGPDEGKGSEVTPGSDECKKPGVKPGSDEGKKPEVTPGPDGGGKLGMPPEDQNKEWEVPPEPDEGGESEAAPVPDESREPETPPPHVPTVPENAGNIKDESMTGNDTQGTQKEAVTEPTEKTDMAGILLMAAIIILADFGVIIVIVAVIVTAIVIGVFCCLLFFLFFSGRRRVIGRIMNVDGEVLEGIRAVLDGRECFTDSEGGFVFHGIRRGRHRLCVCDRAGKAVLIMDVFADAGEDEETFTVFWDETIRAEGHREGRKYFVDVVLPEDI